MFAEELHPLGDSYWKHVGVAEDVIKMGARYGLIQPREAKRAIRMIVSQPDQLFLPDVMAAPDMVKDPAALKDWFSDLYKKGEAEQQGANYGPRIEGHHGVSISSTHSAGEHLPITKQGEFIQELTKAGVPVGTQAAEMYGISKPGHTGNAPIAAHVNPLTGMIDEGYWQSAFDGKGYSDPALLAEAFADESAMPQIRLAELAQNQQGELEIQDAMAEAAGVDSSDLFRTERNNKGKTYANQIKNTLSKEKFDALALNEVVYSNKPAARGGPKGSNKTMLIEERPEANLVRRDLGLGGNEAFAQDNLGKWVQTIRSNNPRRRL